MSLPIAAIVSSISTDTTPLMLNFVSYLKSQGYRVCGLIQLFEPGQNGCDIILIDIQTGARHAISQNLGPASEACRLDPARLVEAGQVLRAIPSATTDLAIFNRFGGLEAQGQGFREEMLAVMLGGTPLLTVVSDKHLDAWRMFTGGLAAELRPEPSELETWFAGVQAASGVHRAG